MDPHIPESMNRCTYHIFALAIVLRGLQRQGHIEELIISVITLPKIFFTAKFLKGEIETFFVTSISYIGSKLGVYKDTC